MEDIKMTDQKAQYVRLKPELDKAFSTVMESMSLTSDTYVALFAKQLEKQFNVKQALPFASDMQALKQSLAMLDLPAGAEIIVPAFTYAASIDELIACGLKPVFADVLSGTFTLDPASVEKAITPDTAAIMPVHLFGQCADMQLLQDIAHKYKLWLIEDATQALGATYQLSGQQRQYAGSVGEISFASFYPSKPLGGMGEAGVLFINSDKLLEKAGTQENAQIDALQAAMLQVKIKYLQDFVEARRKVAQFYNNAFADTPLVQSPYCSPNNTHVYHQYTIKVPPYLRDELKLHLQNNFIPSAVYYPQPLHLQEKYSLFNTDTVKLPVAESLSKSVLSLPIHETLKEDQLSYIVQHVINYVEENTR